MKQKNIVYGSGDVIYFYPKKNLNKVFGRDVALRGEYGAEKT
jgi:hypothetical protein